MANIELSDYVTGLSSATLDGSEEVYLVGNEKTTTQDIADLGNSNVRVYKALISQASTNAPVLTELVNDFGVTVTPTYGAVGAYTLTGFTGLITGLTEVSITCPDNAGTTTAQAAGTSSTNIISINTYLLGVASNDVLSNDPTTNKFGTSVVTIVKYD